MIEKRRGQNILICDSCGRQIVDYPVDKDDKYIVGPRSAGVMITGVNRHACYICIPYERQWEQMCIGDDSL